MKISLCMIVKDEQKFLRQCLDKAITLVDEVIIVDTGSTDDTINIIKEYKDKIKLIQVKWQNDFSKVRNVSMENATGDWILILDADEEIFCNREDLINQISHAKSEGFNLRMINVMDNKEQLNSFVYCRLFRNKGYRYYRAVHEQLNVNRNKIETLDENICKIMHYGYLSENIKLKNKTQRNIDILLKDYEKNPEDSFICYHIGATYAANGEYGKALEFLTKSYSFGMKNGFGNYYYELVKRLSEVILILSDYRLCIDFILQLLSQEKLKEFVDLYYILGNAYYKQKDYISAVKAFNKCLDIGDTKSFPSVSGRGSYSSLMMLGKLYRELHEEKLAFHFYSKACKFKDKLSIEQVVEINDYLDKNK